MRRAGRKAKQSRRYLWMAQVASGSELYWRMELASGEQRREKKHTDGSSGGDGAEFKQSLKGWTVLAYQTWSVSFETVVSPSLTSDPGR